MKDPVALAKADKDFQWVKRLSVLMDSRFRIGKFSFGLDPILNFIPFAGQIITWLISLMLVWMISRHGVSSKVILKMLLNITYDALLGSIPLLGNVFDFFNKANQKNIQLLHDYYFLDRNTGSARNMLIIISIILFILVIAFFWLMYFFTIWLFGLIFN